MKIGQYCQRQRCKHIESEQFWHAFASRGFVSDSWAFLLYSCILGFFSLIAYAYVRFYFKVGRQSAPNNWPIPIIGMSLLNSHTDIYRFCWQWTHTRCQICFTYHSRILLTYVGVLDAISRLTIVFLCHLLNSFAYNQAEQRRVFYF